jgi:hypothetical protein
MRRDREVIVRSLPHPSTYIARAHKVRHDPAMQMSIAMWIAIGVGVIGMAIALLTFIRPQSRAVDLGSVSEQWMAQHRAGPAADLQR